MIAPPLSLSSKTGRHTSGTLRILPGLLLRRLQPIQGTTLRDGLARHAPVAGGLLLETRMWKRDEGVRAPQGPTTPATPPTAGAPAAQAPVVDAPASPSRPLAQPMRDVVNIGKSVVIKGELNGSEDLTIEGQVEGKIELRQNVLTIGPNGKIKAPGVRQGGHRARRSRRQRHRVREGRHPRQRLGRRRSRSRRASPSPKARTSAAASTCSGRAAGDAKGDVKGDAKPSTDQKQRERGARRTAREGLGLHHGGSAARSVTGPVARPGRAARRAWVPVSPPGATRERFHVPAQGSGRPLTDRLFGWGRRAEKDARRRERSPPRRPSGPLPTKAFGRFLHALSLRESPIVLDLGPIVGGNVNFLGERLGCKYLVEDLYAEHRIARHAARTRPTWRRSSRSAFPRPTPASTACCAGTCSTTWTRRRRRSSRAR